MPDPVTWERRDKAYRAIYEALGGQNAELINWERRGEALKAIHDAAEALGSLKSRTVFGFKQNSITNGRNMFGSLDGTFTTALAEAYYQGLLPKGRFIKIGVNVVSNSFTDQGAYIRLRKNGANAEEIYVPAGATMLAWVDATTESDGSDDVFCWDIDTTQIVSVGTMYFVLTAVFEVDIS